MIVNSSRDNGRIVMIYPVLTGLQTILNIVTIDRDEQILIDAATSDPKNLRYLPLDFFNIISARIDNPNKIFITNYPKLSEHISQQVLEITPKKTELKIKDNYRGYFEQKTVDNLTGSLVGNLKYEKQEESLDEWKVKRRIYELDNINFFTFENRFTDVIKSISIEENRRQPIEINFPFQHIVQIKTKKKPEEYKFDISNFNIEVSAFEGQLKYIQKSEETDNDLILTWLLLVAQSFFNTNEIEEYYNFIKAVQTATQHSVILKKI